MITTINIVGYDTWHDERPWCRGSKTHQEFKVSFNQLTNNEVTYFIRDGIYEADKYESKIKVALLTECRPFDIQDRYGFVAKNNRKFDHIVTYDDRLIEEFPDKACPTPEGGTWVWPLEKQKIYDKMKLCSYVVSLKQATKEQRMRVELLQLFYNSRDQFPDIDLYGRGHNPFPEDHDIDFDGKSDILKDYAFSIALENWIQDNYFSEKLMDCFMVGTVPIYMGARKVGEYFNLDGMILVNSIKDIVREVNDLSFEKYNSMLPAIKENFELAKNHYDTVGYSYDKFIREKHE